MFRLWNLAQVTIDYVLKDEALNMAGESVIYRISDIHAGA